MSTELNFRARLYNLIYQFFSQYSKTKMKKKNWFHSHVNDPYVKKAESQGLGPVLILKSRN